MLKDILEKYDLSIADFSSRFGVPYSTACKWCLPPDRPNYRPCPQYILDMIQIILAAGLK